MLTNFILFFIGLIWVGVVGYFILSTSLWGTYLIIIAGIFTVLAFGFSAWVQRKTNQPYGLTIIFSLIGVCLTILAYNQEFLWNEQVYAISSGMIFTLLFFLAIVKIWDSVEYLQG